MSELIFKPDIYEGTDPYIHISYHRNDKDRILPILEKIDMRGFRYWINDGIPLGMEADEVIAEHIEGCDFFISFLSNSYVGCLDTIDELNFSRDTNKDYLLVYLEDVELPYGLDMRFMRSQGINAYMYDDEVVASRIMGISDADKFYGVSDKALRKTAQSIFDRLEQLYPEHKVFALDAIGKNITKEISQLYIKAGYPSVERLLLDYGFTKISTDEARNLRSSVVYQPGFEPDIVKPRIDYIVSTLKDSYPDMVIKSPLSKTHKSIANSLQGISVWLGYENTAQMLEAYGFKGVMSELGRRSVDYKMVFDKLLDKYKDGPKPVSITELKKQNPELAHHIKTINNNAGELFSTTLLEHLKSIGLIVPRVKTEKTTATAINREIIIGDIRKLYENDGRDYGTFDEAFETLKNLKIKRNVKGEVYISDCALCDGVVKIPYGINIIDKEAFSSQENLVELHLPGTVRVIKESAFSDCSSLERIVFAEGIEVIENAAFSGCTALSELDLPSTLKSVGNEAFADCENLADVHFANLRTSVQDDAFDGCIFEISSIQEAEASPAECFEVKVDGKNNAKIVKYIGDEEIVVIPQSINGHPVVSIEKGSFKENNHIKEVYINDNITSINGDAFKNCVNLTKVRISNSVRTFTSSTFAGCTSLTQVNIPDNMTDVVRGLFKDSPITELYIGKNTSRISPDAFNQGVMDFAIGLCFKSHSLEILSVDFDNQHFTSEGSMLLSKDRKILYAELGNPVTSVVPQGVEIIGDGAYEKIGSLTYVELPQSVKCIGEKAFAGTNISCMEFPRSLTTIGKQAFSYCRNLEIADLNEGLEIIGQQAFEGCPINDVFIPASVSELGLDSFLAISAYQGQIVQRFEVDRSNARYLTDGVALYSKDEQGMTLMKAYAYSLKVNPGEAVVSPVEYEIPDNTVAIAPQAFARCNNLINVILPHTLNSIGDMAFMGCSSIKELSVPDTCTDVSPRAFMGTQIVLK